MAVTSIERPDAPAAQLAVGRALFAAEYGPQDAPAVVLLHGSGSSGWMWKNQVQALAGDLHVLVPDLPGHGQSNTIEWVSFLDSAALVADLIASRIPGKRVHVVGQSLGGYVGLQMAASFPGLLTGVTVSGVTVLPVPHARRMRILASVMAPFLTWGPLLRAQARSFHIPAEDFDGYRTSARAMTRQAFFQVIDDAMAFRVPAGAQTSLCSVLALAGEKDDDIVRRSLVEIANAFSDGQAYVVPHAGHWIGEDAELFEALVRSRVQGGPLPEGLQTP